MLRKTKEQFINELEAKYPGKFNTSEVEYVNNKTKVILTCKDCGYRNGYRPDTILKNITVRGCYNCELLNKRERNKSKAITQQEAIEKLEKADIKKEYDFSKVNYLKSTKSISIIHKVCGHEYTTRLYHFVYGESRCPKCQGRDRETEDTIQELKKLYGDLYDYSKVEYKSSTEPITLICRKHNCEFKTDYHKLTTNYGKRRCCPKEWQSNANILIKEILDNFNIKNYSEYILDDCKYKNKLKFDFYLPDKNTVIEYQGEWHYKNIIGNSLEIQQARDQIKREFCKINGIKEIEIPYWEFKNIENILKEELVF